jgi:hypothetical protein
LIAAVIRDAQARDEPVTEERTRVVLANYLRRHPDENLGLVNPAVVLDHARARLRVINRRLAGDP